MGTVTFRISSDVKQLEKDFSKIQRENAKLIEQNRQLASASKQSATASKEQMGKMTGFARNLTSQLTSVATGYLSIRSAVQLVNKGLEEQARLSREALDVQRGVGRAQATALFNLAGLPEAQQAKVLAAAGHIQKDARFPDQVQLVGALGAGISASGDVEATQRAVRRAAEITRLTPEDVGTIAAGALDVATATGNKAARENIGLLLSAGAEARVEDPRLLAGNLAPAIGAALATVPGQDPKEAAREAGAMFGVLARAMTDVSGDKTKTAVRHFAGDLRTFFTDNEALVAKFQKTLEADIPEEADAEFRKRAKVQAKEQAREMAARVQDPGTLRGRARALFEDEQLLAAFLADSRTRESSLHVERLLSDPERFADFERSVGAIGFDVGKFERLRKGLETGSRQLGLAGAIAESEGLTQRFRVGSEIADRATARRIMEGTLEDTRTGLLGFTSDTMASARFTGDIERGMNPFEAAMRQMEERRTELLMGTNVAAEVMAVPFRDMGSLPERSREELPDAQRQQLQLLEEQLQILKDLREESRRTRRQNPAAQAGRHQEG